MNGFASAARIWAARIAATAAIVLVAACGGGSPADTATTPALRAAAMQPMADPAPPTADQAMDWAEAHYPDLFPAASRQPGNLAPYTYRYYPATNNYVGVSTGAADVAVYIHGNVAGGQITRLGTLASYTCTVLPQNCGLSPNIAAWGDSLTPPFAANLQVLFPDRVVYDGGVASQTSTEVVARQVADTQRRTWVSVFWFGHNNDEDPERVKADMATAVATLAAGNNRFIVMSLLNEAVPSELKGTPRYQAILQLNSELAAAYPQNYIDIRGYLVSHYNPAIAQDVADFQNDVVPYSLRHDEGHLNNDGSVLVAQRVRDFINAKGW